RTRGTLRARGARRAGRARGARVALRALRTRRAVGAVRAVVAGRTLHALRSRGARITLRTLRAGRAVGAGRSLRADEPGGAADPVARRVDDGQAVDRDRVRVDVGAGDVGGVARVGHGAELLARRHLGVAIHAHAQPAVAAVEEVARERGARA